MAEEVASTQTSSSQRGDDVAFGGSLRGNALTILALVIGCLGVAGGWIGAPLILGVGQSQQLISDLVSSAVAVTCCVVAIALMRRARRRAAVSADQLLSVDDRAPVVYLRSFETDSRTRKVDAPYWLLSLWAVPLYQLVNEWRGHTEEQYWSSALARIGPTITVGAPGRLPYPGFARLYVSDGEWKDAVSDLVNRAALVVVFGGVSQGLWWEIRHVTTSVSRHKLIFLLPNDELQYDQFRDGLKREFGIELACRPAVAHRMSISGVLRFGEDGDSEVLPVWGASRASVEMALEPVYKPIAAPGGSTREGGGSEG